MHESKQEGAPKVSPKPAETSYGILMEFIKLFFPTMVTRLSLQAYFILLLISREFDSTEKMAAVGMAVSIISVFLMWLNGVTMPNVSLTA